jgi:predicted anti-sigma-YlaC factor YlaD
MSDHESVRGLLALSAAGLLDPDEERVVKEHVSQCGACAADLEAYGWLSAGLSNMPAPQPPVYLVSRTAALVAAEADRRQGAVFAGGAAIFACVFVLLIGQTLATAVGDSAALAWLVWASISSVLGAACALVLASRRRLERSIV